MSTISNARPPAESKRPVLVWVISICYFLSAGWTLLSVALILSGAMPPNEAQKQYFQSLSAFDHGSTIVISGANLLGAVFLFLLKKQAFYLFSGAFTVGIALTVIQIFTKNWLGAIGIPGFIGALLGWGIIVAIILYSRSLITKGVLR